VFVSGIVIIVVSLLRIAIKYRKK